MLLLLLFVASQCIRQTPLSQHSQASDIKTINARLTTCPPPQTPAAVVHEVSSSAFSRHLKVLTGTAANPLRCVGLTAAGAGRVAGLRLAACADAADAGPPPLAWPDEEALESVFPMLERCPRGAATLAPAPSVNSYSSS